MVLGIIAVICLTTAIVSTTVLIDYERAVKGKKSFFWTKGGDE